VAQGDDGDVEIQPLVGYTLDQLAEITEGRPGGKRRGSVVFDTSNVRYVYDKYIEQEVQAGAVRTDGQAVAVPKEPGGDLQSKIAGRRVTVKPGGGE
jgi:hypothetical protein